MYINNDCFETMASLEDASIDLIVTDPPYGISFDGSNHMNNSDWDKMSDEEWLSIFWQYDYMLREDKGIIVELLSEKLDDTTESEVKGILLLLASFNKIVCADEYEYLNYLWRTFQTVFETSINEICSEFIQLQEGAVLLLNEVRE